MISLSGSVYADAQIPGRVGNLPPSPGQAMRDIETSGPSLPNMPVPSLSIPAPQSATENNGDSGARVFVRQFTFAGNTAIGVDKLLALVADTSNREMSFADLQQVAARVTHYYREHGYVLARAYLPHQDIEGGVVRIAIVEGKYGKIVLENHARMHDAVVRQPLGNIREGDPIRGDDLERSLLLLNELPGADAHGTLRVGGIPGTTDLVVDVKKAPLATGALEFDNFGDPSTGRYRVSGNANFNSLLGLADQLSVRGLVSNERQRYYRLGYQVPIGPASTRVGVAYSDMRYRVGGALESLDYHGSATAQSVFVSQPLLRRLNARVTAQIQYETSSLQENYGSFMIHGDKRVGLWSFGVSGNVQDDWLGGGQSGFSVMFGMGRLRSNDVLETDRFTHAMGTFSKLSISALRVQSLGRRFQLYAQFSAQLASRNLDPSQQFSLGGPYAVRAYALGAGSGDQGWQATAELRYLAAPGWQLSTFVDAGRVQVRKQPWVSGDNIQQIQAGGLGATWIGSNRHISLTASWTLGAALDSSVRAPSIWIQASQYF
ncbi:ShlB/FhaC/HecB family hemolysin secretion/activation protein [Burkholderia stagnalis]|nr:ShlB/FhaC/HecB family hemolysin secretion/activation protein [Burkholderia stagnalis]MDY7803415.1 ShlB/FhaC/HecB family hemolysin secretion/activation protein [Burkholderia stagnalis]